MRFSFFISFLLFYLNIFAQKYPYKYVSQIDSILRNSIDDDFRYQSAATEYSLIGEYNKMLHTIDEEFDDSIYFPTPAQKNLISKYTPVQAVEYILKKAKKTRIIIFNEAHYQPIHRAFVTSLLPLLKNMGYDFLGIEALGYTDSLLPKRKYPILSTGYYTREPSFGNLIRTALAIGLNLFPYDAYVDTMQIREIREAKNIKSFMDKNPNSKIIIFCGFDHAIKDSIHNRMIIPMAGRLRQMTGIDPFTIDQIQLTERSNPLFENHYRQLIDLNYDAILIDNNNEAFNKANPQKVFDCNVYHPNTYYIHGRPNWLCTPGKLFVDIKSKISIQYPCLIKVYKATDNIDEAVPIDILELENEFEEKQIIVNKNEKYVVVITNIKGEKQIF